MDKKIAMRLLKDLNMDLDLEELNQEHFLTILKNYVYIDEVV